MRKNNKKYEKLYNIIYNLIISKNTLNYIIYLLLLVNLLIDWFYFAIDDIELVILQPPEYIYFILSLDS